ncbi:uncharacterized protein K489DRAFT_254892 [Dissoconium aciculare CBS 342.82]|uniref:Uncharacterized protein n=1 Tax=Dissoconium aciculare CBS 342.82 TaxID=1314786 RepID=A0A6J3M1G2_9PEZI|nr:uncharacterized protein K489DRAFT_254892 [Dissoconium aciculare CBS 342.82]KAF1821728.1 hypothetical protein K489DRAFT_254892 [Dissoconium aciculare CBS 342.82]
MFALVKQDSCDAVKTSRRAPHAACALAPIYLWHREFSRGWHGPRTVGSLAASKKKGEASRVWERREKQVTGRRRGRTSSVDALGGGHDAGGKLFGSRLRSADGIQHQIFPALPFRHSSSATWKCANYSARSHDSMRHLRIAIVSSHRRI